jgi:hypothetical protein
MVLSRILSSAPNIVVNARRAWQREYAVCAMRNKLKLSTDGGDSGSKKCKRGCGGSCGGVWLSLRLTGVWSYAVGFVTFYKNLASVAVKTCSRVISFVKIFPKYYTFSGISKYNITINCITAELEIFPFPRL